MKWHTICKACRGKCCGPPYLSRNELLKIEKEIGRKVKVSKKGNLYRFVQSASECQFNDKGCTLKNKPLACEIYPFLPTERGWVIRTSCPYWYELTKEDLRRTRIQFAKRKCDWGNSKRKQ